MSITITPPDVINVTITPPDVINIQLSKSAGLPSGGETGQVLRKKTAQDYDAEWSEGTSAYYVHSQTTASAEWIINHNFGRHPIVQVYSVGMVKVIAEIVHVSLNQTRVYFALPVAGVAYAM